MHLLCVFVCMQLQQVGMGATPCACLTIILTLHAHDRYPIFDWSCPELNFLFSTRARYPKRVRKCLRRGDAHTPQPRPLGASFLTLSEQQILKTNTVSGPTGKHDQSKTRRENANFLLFMAHLFFPCIRGIPGGRKEPSLTPHPPLLQPLAASQNTLDHPK